MQKALNKIKTEQKRYAVIGEKKAHEENVFNYKEITYVDDMKKQMNFSFL